MEGQRKTVSVCCECTCFRYIRHQYLYVLYQIQKGPGTKGVYYTEPESFLRVVVLIIEKSTTHEKGVDKKVRTIGLVFPEVEEKISLY